MDERAIEFKKCFSNSRFTQDYCNANNIIQKSCESNENGIMDCTNIEKLGNLPCLINQTDFSNILIKFPKGRFENTEGNFNVRQYSSKFLESFNSQYDKTNTKINHSKFMRKLTLYGTFYDLAQIKELTSEMTELVEIKADTVYLNPHSSFEIDYHLDIKARIVSLNSPLIMKMSKAQFLDKKSVESWAYKEEFYKNGNVTMQRIDFGLVKILKTADEAYIEDLCKPKVVNIEDADFDISDWFDVTAINLQYVYARSLFKSGTNKELVNSIAKFMLGFVYNSPVVTNPKIYYAAQKFLHLLELNGKINIHNVPSFSIKTISQFSEVMYQSMNKYRDDERAQELELALASGRVEDMYNEFKMFQREQQSYLDREQEIINLIFDSSASSNDLNFKHREAIENKTSLSLSQIQNQTEKMQLQYIQQSLRRAKQSQDHMEEVIVKSTEHLSRLKITFFDAKKILADYNRQFNAYTDEIKKIKPEIEKGMNEWKNKQIAKAALNVMTSIFSLGGVFSGGIDDLQERKKREIDFLNFNLQEEIVDVYIARPESRIHNLTESHPDIFIRQKRFPWLAVKVIFEVLEKLAELTQTIWELVEVLESVDGLYEILDTLSFDASNAITIDLSLDYRKTLATATEIQLQAPKFINLKLFGEIVVERMNRVTDNDIDSIIDMQKALIGASDTGKLMITQASLTADTLLKLLKQKDELEISINDKERTVVEMRKIESELEDFKTNLKQTSEKKYEAKLKYERDVQELKDNYNTATNSQKENYRTKVTRSFNKLQNEVKSLESKYFIQLSSLQTSIHHKFIGLREHSMNQRLMVLDLFMNYCDVAFYHSFTTCENFDLPSISDDFGIILDKLSKLKWNTILSKYKIDGNPQKFGREFIINPATETKPNGNLSLIVQTFKETGQIYINLAHLEDGQKILKMYRRIRVKTVRIQLLDQEENIIYSKNSKHVTIKIEYPKQFIDCDNQQSAHNFWGQGFTCTSVYGRGKYRVITELCH